MEQHQSGKENRSRSGHRIYSGACRSICNRYRNPWKCICWCLKGNRSAPCIFPGHQLPVLLWKKSRRCHQDRYHHVYVQHIPGCCDCCRITLTLAEASSDLSAPQGIAEVLSTLLGNIVANPIDSLVNANYIGVLFWAVLIGIGMRAAGETSKNMLNDVSSALSKVVTWIISFAPFGILGLVFNTVSTNGLSIFTEYGKLLAVLVGSMLFIYFVTNPILVFWCIRKNPYPLIFKCLKKSAITAFFTRSSAANIPINMEACEEMGLDKDTYSVTIPLGATINMDGAAITITVMALATAHTLGIAVDIPSALILSVLATLSACGASGVAGGSLLLIPMACSLFGIPNDVAMQVVGVGFIIGVIQDSVETALNSSSDLLLSASAEFRQWRKEGKEIKF